MQKLKIAATLILEISVIYRPIKKVVQHHFLSFSKHISCFRKNQRAEKS